MFPGSIVRTLAFAVICLQVVATVFVVALVPAPQGTAHACEPACLTAQDAELD